MKIESLRYRMPHSVFLRKCFLLYGKKWLVILPLVALVFFLAGIFLDMRWAIVALMVVFLISPMVIAMLYYSIGMRKECAMNVIDHLVRIYSDRIEMDVFRSDPDSEDESVFSVSYTDEELNGMTLGLDEIFLKVGEKGRGFIWIPRSAFAEESVFINAAEVMLNLTHGGHREK